jgi:glycosyltransferase involved in cell wall biosynthesis
MLAGTSPLFVTGYEKRQPRGYSIRDSAPATWSIVREAKLDALVIHGHSVLANHFATLAARSQRIPVFYQCDASIRNAHGGWLRRAILRGYYATIDGFLASSSTNRDYFRALGVAGRKIHHFPLSVDNERFLAASALSDCERRVVRQRLGLRAGVPTLVSASKLVAQKRIGDLVETASRLREQGLDFDLLLIGEGNERSALERAAAKAHGAPFIFSGFRNQTEMPALFGLSDIFVMTANNENFGLVINEAMCAGLPVVASTGIGAVRDLVRDGENGRIFEAGDQGALAEVLRSLITDPDLCQRMGRASRKIIAGWGYKQDIEGLRAALVAMGKLPR